MCVWGGGGGGEGRKGVGGMGCYCQQNWPGGGRDSTSSTTGQPVIMAGDN